MITEDDVREVALSLPATIEKPSYDSEPEKFFTTSHYDGHPTVLVRFDAIGTKELRELLSDSWRLRAPTKLVAEFDRTVTTGRAAP